MKKIFTLFAALAVTLGSFAQTDIAVNEVVVLTDANDDYLTGSAGPVSIVWENVGDPLVQGDTVFFAIRLNGATLTIPGFLVGPNGYATNQVDTFNYHATTADPNSFAQRLGNLSLIGDEGTQIGGAPIGPNRIVTAFPLVFKLNGGGANADTNPMNDTVSVSANLVDGDFATGNLQVTDGDVMANNEIPLNGSIDTISFELSNQSALDFYHYSMNLELDINGVLDTFAVVLSRGATPWGAFTGALTANGGTLNLQGNVDNALIPTTTVGTFDICVRHLYGTDANTANDQECVTYTVVDTASGGSTNVGEIFASTQVVYTQNNLIVVENVLYSQAVTVTNIAGQVVYNGVLTAGRNEFGIDGQTGIYIVRTEEKTEKVILK